LKIRSDPWYFSCYARYSWAQTSLKFWEWTQPFNGTPDHLIHLLAGIVSKFILMTFNEKLPTAMKNIKSRRRIGFVHVISIKAFNRAANSRRPTNHNSPIHYQSVIASRGYIMEYLRYLLWLFGFDPYWNFREHWLRTTATVHLTSSINPWNEFVFRLLDVCHPTTINDGEQFIFHSDTSRSPGLGASGGVARLQTCNTTTDAQSRYQIVVNSISTWDFAVFEWLVWSVCYFSSRLRWLWIRALYFDLSQLFCFFLMMNSIQVNIRPALPVRSPTVVLLRQLWHRFLFITLEILCSGTGEGLVNANSGIHTERVRR
jgi:hypothetical protein